MIDKIAFKTKILLKDLLLVKQLTVPEVITAHELLVYFSDKPEDIIIMNLSTSYQNWIQVAETINLSVLVSKHFALGKSAFSQGTKIVYCKSHLY